AECLRRPLRLVGQGRTSQSLPWNRCCQAVIGTTTRNANTPIESRLMTTAGRTLRISSPSVGSRLTSQISLRDGVIKDVLCVQACPFGQLATGFVKIFQGRCRCRQPLISNFAMIGPVGGQIVPNGVGCGFDYQQTLGVV